MKLKRYLVFTYDCYYPLGGWDDFRDSFDTIEEAKACNDGRDMRDIVDTETGELVE